MKLSHINEIKGKIFLNTKVKSTNLLDGAYKSIFKGKSLDFEELREYNVGDNVKDIDWRASARSLKVLIREHIAEKKHNIMFVLDSKYDMNANANDDEIKRDICTNVAGTLAYLAYKNGDNTGAIFMENSMPVFFPLRQQLFHIENYLTFYDESLKNQKLKKRKVIENSINDSLKYLVSFLLKRSLIVIITDLYGIETLDEELVKSLSYRNDVMIACIKDISLYNSRAYDIENRRYFAKMISKNRKLVRIEDEAKERVFNEACDKYKKYRINIILIENLEEVVPKIIELINQHNNLINKK